MKKYFKFETGEAQDEDAFIANVRYDKEREVKTGDDFEDKFDETVSETTFENDVWFNSPEFLKSIPNKKWDTALIHFDDDDYLILTKDELTDLIEGKHSLIDIFNDAVHYKVKRSIERYKEEDEKVKESGLWGFLIGAAAGVVGALLGVRFSK